MKLSEFMKNVSPEARAKILLDEACIHAHQMYYVMRGLEQALSRFRATFGRILDDAETKGRLMTCDDQSDVTDGASELTRAVGDMLHWLSSVTACMVGSHLAVCAATHETPSPDEGPKPGEDILPLGPRNN